MLSSVMGLKTKRKETVTGPLPDTSATPDETVENKSAQEVILVVTTN